MKYTIPKKEVRAQIGEGRHLLYGGGAYQPARWAGNTADGGADTQHAANRQASHRIKIGVTHLKTGYTIFLYLYCLIRTEHYTQGSIKKPNAFTA